VLVTVQSSNGTGVANEVWDISDPNAPTVAVDLSSQLANTNDYPSAVAIASDGEILVLSAFDGLFAFDSCGGYIGSIVPLVQNGYFTAGDGQGLAYVPQPDGGGVVVICDADVGPVAFGYGGSGDFDGGAKDYPNWLWPQTTPNISAYQCFAGAGNTVYVAGTDNGGDAELMQFDAVSGMAATGIAPPLTYIYGGAMDVKGNVLVVGDDQAQGVDYGAAELYSASPVTVTNAVTGAPHCTDLVNCLSPCACDPISPNLALTDSGGDGVVLGQAAALPDGGFLATYSNYDDFGSGPPFNMILELQPGASGLTVGKYYSTSSGSPLFFGIASAPP
jgi:hypothetical protein